MKLKPSFFLHCITNRGLPFPSNIVDGQIQGHQPACDGHHSRHSVCSNWPDVIVPEVERRELGLLVALDGLADRAYALILEVVEGQIQGRQPAINAQGVSDCSDALCGVGALLVSGEVDPDATQLVSGDVDACQLAFNAQGVSDCSDALYV